MFNISPDFMRRSELTYMDVGKVREQDAEALLAN